MTITMFNWNELLLVGRQDFAAILCLAYAQTPVYNELSSKTLMDKLKIHHIPPSLFQQQYFTQYKHSLVCNYRTREPQSYFKNSSFLFVNAPARMKVVYIKALSMRKLSNTEDYIPFKYFENIKPNYFLTIKEDKILFPLESSLSRNNITKN